jgi:EAL domain-containing protein (putative c-di-GMP-specific phosphodiesterase class I)
VIAVSDEDQSTIRQVLDLARGRLGMDAAWISRVTSSGQRFDQVVQSTPEAGRALLNQHPLSDSYCPGVLDERLPAIIPDARADRRTRDLKVTAELNIGSYVGVPIRAADGEVRGMLCCISSAVGRHIRDRDLRFLGGLAAVVAELDVMDKGDPHQEAKLEEAWRRMKDVIAGKGLRMVLQPVVELANGRMYGAEALARFDGHLSCPEVWFADAARLGVRKDLEVAAIEAAVARLKDLPNDAVLSINASPDVITSGGLEGPFGGGAELRRIALEVTEKAPVSDYAALTSALSPFRTAGLRVSVDDAGAGYASFRHIVQLRPDIIKIDMSLIRDIDADPVSQALVTSLATFAATTETLLIAEGVETQAELDMLVQLGVSYAQGYLLGRPAFEVPTGTFVST